jgi:SAM-dependent methyltransferase
MAALNPFDRKIRSEGTPQGGQGRRMAEREYVLGTQDEEIERLGLQHRVWRPQMLEGFRRAGIAEGQIVIDVGAGPGFATADLAELVGASGRVIALERSRRFLDSLAARVGRHGLANVEPRESDVSAESFGDAVADASWCRWLLSFVADPRATIGHIAKALKPGGVALFHEYGDYDAWRTLPPDPLVERFRQLVMQSWRDSGGEPDIALRLPEWIEDEGMEIVSVRPMIHVVQRTDFVWRWPAAFMATGALRLAELGYIERDEAGQMATALDRLPPTAWMTTPLVLEILARKRG